MKQNRGSLCRMILLSYPFYILNFLSRTPNLRGGCIKLNDNNKNLLIYIKINVMKIDWDVFRIHILKYFFYECSYKFNNFTKVRKREYGTFFLG